MAYSVADIPAADRDLAAANKPILLGRNWLRSAGTFRGWDADGVSTFTNIAAATFESKFAGDDHDYLVTKPNAAANNQYFVFDFGSEGMTFDSFALLNHNLGTITGVTVTLWVTNDPSLEGNWTQIASIGPVVGNKRLVELVLKDSGSVARRFSSVRYFRVRFAKGSAHTPQFGEMILSRRRQLKHAPNVPWDPNRWQSRASVFEAASGATTNYVLHKGRRRIAASFNPHEDAFISDLETFFETDTDFGTKTFMYIDRPAAAPTDASWMRLDEAALSANLVGFTERDFSIVAEEQGPNFLKLGV